MISPPPSKRSPLACSLAVLAVVLMTPTPGATQPARTPARASEGAARVAALTRQIVFKSASSIAAPPEVWLSDRLRGDALGRIRVGDQAGLLKVQSEDGARDLFVKQDPRISIKGLDTVYLARVSADDRRRILDAIGVSQGEIEGIVRTIDQRFDQLAQRPAVALLGVLAAAPEAQLGATGAHIRSVLCRILRTSEDVSVRRQCVLSLAVAAATDEPTVRAVVAFMSQTHNAWETFTTQQYFAYHADYVRALPALATITDALDRSGNPYARDIVTQLAP